MRVIKIILSTSYEFKLEELSGDTIDEKTENAINIARGRLKNAVKTNVFKPLLQERVVISK